jgi:SsrA-binding protein
MGDILQNSRARHDYEILETVEAGLVLRGTEVKALRAGKAQISDAFARIERGQAWLHNAHIDEYSHGNLFNHVPKTPRKLLLHKAEIGRLEALSHVKGHALVPLALYWKGNRIKVRLAVGRGRDVRDKRHELRRREDERDMRKAMAHARKS